MRGLLIMLRNLLKRNQELYLLLRSLRSLLMRFRYGLKSADRTAYVASGCSLCTDIVLGPYSYIGPGARIAPGVSIGAYVMLGPEVLVIGRDHRIDLPGVPIIFSGRPEFKRTIIEDDAWIGARAILIAGVIIGRGSVVAAGAVVTHDVPPYAVIGGVPAKIMRYRFTAAEIVTHDAMLGTPTRGGVFCEDTGVA